MLGDIDRLAAGDEPAARALGGSALAAIFGIALTPRWRLGQNLFNRPCRAYSHADLFLWR
jgi:hypothetical protein